MNINIEPIKVGDGYFVEVIIDGVAMSAPRGPYVDADTAGSVARRLRLYAYTLSEGGNRE